MQRAKCAGEPSVRHSAVTVALVTRPRRSKLIHVDTAGAALDTGGAQKRKIFP
jgi:hypothetical protein